MIAAAVRDDGALGQMTGGEKTEARPWFRGGIGRDVGDLGGDVVAEHVQVGRYLAEFGKPGIGAREGVKTGNSAAEGRRVNTRDE